ncbi:chaplin [Streptomyces sp. SP18CS02]|uniref:chaplin n=1 Tax=Streptomyces sp. SP18CS02 TaxID=3002531 RepID=UPI002E761FF5|nr:chaplin [Streptomyces sp. SP18CS02]MEE1754955.1 chaplin [Streptomyces sp. SP18CS02]
MRHTRRNGLAALMATGGALALAAGYAHADSDAAGGAAQSPGVISGNTVQLPVDVPVNVCGNTINVVGLLNPSAGNRCENNGASGTSNKHKDQPATPRGNNGSGQGRSDASQTGGGGASADGAAVGSPGVISGNGIQLPIDLPVNVSGNSVSLVGVLNPAFGNSSSNGGGKTPPVTPVAPPKDPEAATPPEKDEPAAPGPVAQAPEPQISSTSLAHTGADGLLGVGAPVALGLLIGGATLYRRFRPARLGA